MGASREIDNFLQKLKPKGSPEEDKKDDREEESEGSKKPVDDNIDSLLADSDEENKEPPRQSPKTSEQNQEFYVCPYPKGYCSKKWKKYKGHNAIQVRNSMKNHILNAHYENEFTRLLNDSFTGAGKCKQCKNINKYGLKQRKKHLRETHKVLQDKIAPLLLAAFPKTRKRPSNSTKGNSQVPVSSQKDSSQIIEEIQSRLSQDLSDESSDDDEEDIRSPKKSTPPKDLKDLRNQITIDFSDSDGE